jgi:hypothetical protein
VVFDQFDQFQPSGEVPGGSAFVDKLSLNGFDPHYDGQL